MDPRGPDDFDFDRAMERYDLAALRWHLAQMEGRDGNGDQLFGDGMTPLYSPRKWGDVTVSERYL